MDIVFNILLILHFGALALGAATTIAAPIVMSRAAAVPAEARPVFGGIGARLALNARIALGALIVTGVLMLWIRYGGVEGLNWWFWAKMVLVVVMVVMMIVGIVGRGRVNPAVASWITRLSFIGIVVAAVFAFS